MKKIFAGALRAPLGALALACAVLTGCGGGSDDKKAVAPVEPPVAPPVAQNRAPSGGLMIAGLLVSADGNADTGALLGSDMQFDAGGSSDPDGDKLSFTWSLVSKPAGSTVVVQNTSARQPLRPDLAGTYVLNVQISDGKGATINKQASVIASANIAPLNDVTIKAAYPAKPEPAASPKVSLGGSIGFSGTDSRNAAGQAVVTSWELLERPAGSSSTLGGSPASATLSPDRAGIYKVRARGVDPLGAVSETVYLLDAVGNVPSMVSVGSVENGSPDAAGTTIGGTIGYKVSLGSAVKSSADGQPLSYAWTLVSKPAASTATLDGTTGAYAQFTPDALGDYVVRMVASTPSGLAGTYTTTVAVKNRQPVAAIDSGTAPTVLPGGPTVRLPVKATVTLSGTGSTDADGNALTYAWTLQSKPDGSAGKLSASDQPSVQLTPDLSGPYVVVLRVTDPSGAWSEQSLVIAGAGPTAAVNKGRVTVTPGTAVKVSAGLSVDDDGEVLSYKWALDTKPGASSATINSSTAQLDFTPDVAGTYVASVTVTDGKASSIAYVTIEALASLTTSTSLPFKPLITRYSRGLDRLVTISAGPDLLRIVDPFTGTLRQVPLPGAVVNMNLSPDGKLAVVLHTNLVSLVDLDKGVLLRSSVMNGKQSEGFVTNEGLLYLAGPKNFSLNSTITVINGRTGQDSTALYNDYKADTATYYNGIPSHGVYSSVYRKAIWSENKDSELRAFSHDAGGKPLSRPGWFQPRVPVPAPLFLSANEDLLFTGAGNYLRTDTLAPVGTLNVTGIDSLSHSASLDELILTASAKTTDYFSGFPYKVISTYESSYYRFQGASFAPDAKIALPAIAGSPSYGIAIFHGTNDKHVALVQTGGATSTSSDLKYHVVVTR